MAVFLNRSFPFPTFGAVFSGSVPFGRYRLHQDSALFDDGKLPKSCQKVAKNEGAVYAEVPFDFSGRVSWAI